jgi:hypothetical protein
MFAILTAHLPETHTIVIALIATTVTVAAYIHDRRAIAARRTGGTQ